MTDENNKAPKPKKWPLALFLFGVVLFMYLTVMFKIKYYGP